MDASWLLLRVLWNFYTCFETGVILVPKYNFSWINALTFRSEVVFVLRRPVTALSVALVIVVCGVKCLRNNLLTVFIVLTN